MAKLYFRYSAMNSGKSTNLLQVAHNYEERGMRVLIAKPGVDTKDGSKVSSRLGLSREVDYIINEDDNLYGVFALDAYFGISDCHDSDGEILTISCIIIDESQFLTRDHVNQLFEFASQKNIPVICYGLRTDFRGQGFPGATRLLELAHSIEELKTICRCGKKATMNGRVINGEFVKDGSQVAIDNDNCTYESLCGKCYLSKVQQPLA